MSLPSQRKRAARLATACRPVAEELEGRALLCALHFSELIEAPVWSNAVERRVGGDVASGDAVSISWANRDQTSDRFTETFGASAAAARLVVDQVLADWSRAITSFNRADGTSSLQVNISMNSSGVGFGAGGAPDSSSQPADGKPRTGSMTINRGNDTNSDGKGDGGGWYIDPTPGDSSEFLGGVINAFSGNRTSGSSFDLYTVVSLELTHVLGFISGTGWSYKFATTPLITTSTSPDVAEAGASNTGTRGYYARFDGPTIQHLLTTNNNGSGGTNWGTPIHTAGGAANVTLNGTNYRGGEDSGNAVYDSARYLPNEVVLRILADTYGYSIADPATLPNMYAVLDSSTGLLTVRGHTGSSNSADVIDIAQNGTKLVVSVNIGSDTPGSGALPGVGDLAAYVTEFDMSAVTSVSVIAGDGNDTIAVDGVENITVRGGQGDDTLRLRKVISGVSIQMMGDEGNDQNQLGENRAGQFNTMNGIAAANVTLNGGTGDDFVHLEDAGQTSSVSYTIDKYEFFRNGIRLAYLDASNEYCRLYNGSAPSTTSVYGTRIPTTVYGGDGADAFYVGNTSNVFSDIGSAIELRGEGGTADSIEVNDTGYANPGIYTITSNTVTRTAPTPTGTITFNQMDNFLLRGGGATDEFHVTSTGNDVAYRINGGANSDRFYVRDNSGNRTLGGIDGAIIFDGEAGGDEVLFYDQDESSPQTYVLNNNTLAVANMASVSTISVANVEVYGGSGADTFDVTPSGNAEYLVEGNGNSGGQDTLIVRTSGTTSPTQVPTSATAGTWTFGNREDVIYTEIENPNGGGTTNAVPTISAFTAAPSSVTIGNGLTLTATAADSDGTVATVRYYRETNGTSGLQVGSDTLLISVSGGNPWSAGVSTTGWTLGSNTLYAQATDNANAVSTAFSTTVTVNSAGNPAPVIGNFGAAPDTVTVGANTTLIAGSVTDSNGTIASVGFYRETNGVAGLQVGSDTLLGTVAGPISVYQLSVSTSGYAGGSHTFYAVATDNGGATSTPLSASITVTPASSAPTMSALEASPASVASNGTISLTAVGVADADGYVASVSFFRESNGVAGYQVGGDTLVATDTNGADGWFTSLPAAGLGTGSKTFYAVASDNVGLTSTVRSASVTITSVVAPTCVYAGMIIERRPFTAIALFSADVGASLQLSDVSLRNRATGASIAFSSFTWDAASGGATFVYNGGLTDGNYRFTVHASGISAGGVQLAADYTSDFFILAGDTNFDRDVDFDDLLVLARNYGTSGKGHSQGNFDRSADGSVNFDDLLMLARNYGKTLAAPAAFEALPLAASPSRTRNNTSIASTILT